MKKNKKINDRLNELYLQRDKINEEINHLQNQISEDFTKEEKINIFKSLFVSREDIFAKEWTSKDNVSKFYPVHTSFKGKTFLPISSLDIESHLRGTIHLASYVINKFNLCKYIVLQISSDSKEAIVSLLKKNSLSAYFQIDSNDNLLMWMFFQENISAKDAKLFALQLLKDAYISGKTYPNSDFVNSSVLGSLIELPLQLKQRSLNKTLFINSKNEIIIDQWKFLNNVQKVSKQQFYSLLKTYVPNKFDEIEFPDFDLELILYDFVYIRTQNLSQTFLNKLKAFASFENPQIKILLNLRKPLYNTPRMLKNYEEDEDFLKLPRGLLYKIKDYFKDNDLQYSIKDKRILNKEEFPEIVFTLRPEQNDAIKEISKYDFSLCIAPPGYGKTLIASKMIEIRSCNALVLVNKNMLLDQWIERFVDYFSMNKKDIGFLGKSKNKLNGKLDIATMQSLKNNPELIENYSFVIVDECHHIPAITFEQIIKSFKGKYILGLSATPNRKDGLEEILYEQVGKVAYEFKKKKTITHDLEVVETEFSSNSDNYATLINEICIDENRNNLIFSKIKENLSRKILVLSDRIEHINILVSLLEENNIDYVYIHGSMSKKEQNENIKLVQTKSLVLATTSYFGEGIDFPHLNTIMFITPISYYGRLVQYLGRVGRNGQKCLAIDFLDTKNAMLKSTFKKRSDGYKQMHYKRIK